MSISKVEKERRSGKRMHEQLDGIIEKILNGPNAEEILTQWALNDPKGFSQLAASRMPKVQPVDQDLQKHYISLKAMLLELPDIEDINLALTRLRKENNRLKFEANEKDEHIKFLEKKKKALEKKARNG